MKHHILESTTTATVALVFIILKVTGQLAWPWLWALSPLWIAIIVIASLLVAGIVKKFTLGKKKKEVDLIQKIKNIEVTIKNEVLKITADSDEKIKNIENFIANELRTLENDAKKDLNSDRTKTQLESSKTRVGKIANLVISETRDMISHLAKEIEGSLESLRNEGAQAVKAMDNDLAAKIKDIESKVGSTVQTIDNKIKKADEGANALKFEVRR